ncbi:MAG TPA: lysylphosphatidylglycerol synthase transmembrane domain-containing protein [Xanthobacteraceae bacterium]|nr:lysylphosphatidylglycerol synthase transmembrane domain-containing protein [Xanthobacteraceae bacterium]
MSHSTALPVRSLSKGQGAAFALKIAITLACFWYLLRHIDTAELQRTLPGIDMRWSMLAIALLVSQIPLVGLRWLQIVKILAMRGRQVTWIWMSVAAGIAQFFGQILPVVAGDGVRVWFLGRFSSDWRNATISVVIDRCVGIGLLLAFTLVILLLPSNFGAFEQDRDKVVVALATMLILGVICLVVSARLGPKLTGWRYGRWIERFFSGARAAVFGSRSAVILGTGCVIHALTIAAVWSLGRAQGLALSPADAAVLFAVMIGVALVPFTVGGWGLRELAMVSLFGNHGLTPERALVFSMYFGLTSILASLPGALAWMALLFSRSQRVGDADPQI